MRSDHYSVGSSEIPSVLADMFPMVRYLAADFPFGTDFVADFVGPGPFSGGWDIHFIELEPPNAHLLQEW